MNLCIFQKGFNYSQDGPGNRLVYHLQGCNMHCPWCSNPEGISLTGGTPYTIKELIDEITRSSILFFDNGGITLTGGEATLQFEAIKDLLSQIYTLGIHTCIETNGSHPKLPELFPYLDLLIMDIKHYDSKQHKKFTGLSCETTIQNITAALNHQQNLLLRIPLIGGFNASAKDAVHFAALLNQLDPKKQISVELLCYHEYGKSKYDDLNIFYSMGQDAFISKETLQTFSHILETHGIQLVTT